MLNYLSPRSSAYLSSKHPILSVISRSNTDLYVILGKRIAESMFVCNYALKWDKQEVCNKNSLRKPQNGFEDSNYDRALVSSIARGSVISSIAGGQEAV